jgi:hypothetical protein
MPTITELVGPPQRINWAKPENKVRSIRKNQDGSMWVEFHSGKTTTLPADCEEIQAFVIYSILMTQF